MTVTSFKKNDGGAVYTSGSTTVLNVSDSTFSSNTATGDGGAIYVNGGKFNSSNTLYHNNTAVDEGGAVHLQSGVSGTNHTFSGDFFTSNSVTSTMTSTAGALRVRHPVTIDYSAFVGNTAAAEGGYAISLSNTVGNIIRNSTFSGNNGHYVGAPCLHLGFNRQRDDRNLAACHDKRQLPNRAKPRARDTRPSTYGQHPDQCPQQHLIWPLQHHRFRDIFQQRQPRDLWHLRRR